MIGVFTATKHYEIETGQFIVNTIRIKDRQINKYQLLFFYSLPSLFRQQIQQNDILLK